MFGAQPLINPRGRLRDSLYAIVPFYNHFPQRSVTKFGIFPKIALQWRTIFKRMNILSPNFCVCCGYLIQSGVFEILVQAMLLRTNDFVWASFFCSNIQIFGKLFLKLFQNP